MIYFLLYRLQARWVKMLASLCLIGVVWFPAGSSMAQLSGSVSVFPDVYLHEIAGNEGAAWSTIRPAGRHVVFLVAANDENSKRLLRALGETGQFDGKGVFVWVQGSQNDAKSFAEGSKPMLPAAVWRRVSREAVQVSLRQATVPQSFGLEPSGVVAWTFPGVPRDPGETLSMVSSWIP